MQKYINGLFLIIIFGLAIYIVRGQLKDDIKKLSDTVAAQAQTMAAVQSNLSQVVDFLNKREQSQRASPASPAPNLEGPNPAAPGNPPAASTPITNNQ